MGTLALQGLHKRFGTVTALDGLDLELASGELVSLLGPSGCGKTTALRIVAGFEVATSGRVQVAGRDVTDVPANKRDMGMVFQAYSLFPNLTAAENVEFGLRVRRQAKAARAAKVAELLELVGLASAAGRYPYQLSGGQQQRIALARALAIEPSVLLLDEPLSALDAKVRVNLREEIRRIQLELGITTLYVTHDQEEALSISDRVAVMSQGRLEQVGTPAEVYRRPATPFVAEFVGTVNRLTVRVVDPAAGIVEHRGRRLETAEPLSLTAGAETRLLVRPEALVPSLAGADGTADGIGGRVVGTSFLGAVTRLWVDLGDGAVVAADVQSAAADAFTPGTAVALSIRPGAGRVLASDRSEADPVVAELPA